jgi:hypothetical protein
MQQLTSAPGDPVTKTFGSLTITAQVTVDGAYSISTMTGPIREANLCFATADRELYKRVYRLIAEGGLAGVRPDGIHAALLDALTGDLHAAMRRRDGRTVEALNAALDRLATPAQALADRQTLAGIAATIRTGRQLSGFGRIRAGHATAVQRDRAEVAGQTELFPAVA